MKLIRCTKKLLDELRRVGLEPTNREDPGTVLGDWHANLLRIDRRKCLLFTSTETLFTFLIPGVRRQQLGDFSQLFQQHLELHLAAEGLPDDVVRAVSRDRDMVITRTRSRSVLGSMNDLALQYRYIIDGSGGFTSYDELEATRAVNRTPMSFIGYRRGTDVLKEQLGRLAT